LAAKGVQTAFQGGYIYGPTPTTPYSGLTVAQGIDKPELDARVAAGGTVDWLIMDGFPATMLYQTTDGTWTTPKFTPAQAYSELVSYASYLLGYYPSLKIGLDVNFPNWPYGGVKNYWGSSALVHQPHGNTTEGSYNYYWSLGMLPDYATILAGMVSALRGAGLPVFACVQADNPYDYFMGWRGNNWNTAAIEDTTTDWVAQLLALQQQVQGLGIPFGAILHTEYSQQNGPISRVYYEVLDHLAELVARGASPDQIQTSDFWSYDLDLLPVGDRSLPFTLGNMHSSVVRGDPTNVPLWRNSQPVTNQNIVFTNMGDRAYYMRNGYPADNSSPVAYFQNGITRYSSGVAPEVSSPVWSLTHPGGGSTITGSPTELQSLTSSGWTVVGTVYGAEAA